MWCHTASEIVFNIGSGNDLSHVVALLDVAPVSNWSTSFSLHINQTNNSWAILKFDFEKSKVKVMAKVKDQGHRVYPVSTAIPFCFTSIGPIILEIWPLECLTLKKHIRNFGKKFEKKNPKEQGKSEGSDSCDQPSNLTQIGFKMSILQPV